MYVLMCINIVMLVMLMPHVIKTKSDFQQFKSTVLIDFYIICSKCSCGKQMKTL